MAHEGLQQRWLSAGIYTKYILFAIYQHVVLGFSFNFVWKCPVDTVLLPLFFDNLSHQHLDCGVANGYLCAAALSRTKLPFDNYEFTLLDLNENCLAAARSAILAKEPSTKVQCVTADIRDPLPGELEGMRFKSISMFNLFHCVPGGQQKLRAFRTYKQVLDDDGTLAGCTILAGPYIYRWLPYLLMNIYNVMGAFNNWYDTKEEFEIALRREFAEVEVSEVGMVLLFQAKGPLRD